MTLLLITKPPCKWGTIDCDGVLRRESLIFINCQCPTNNIKFPSQKIISIWFLVCYYKRWIIYHNHPFVFILPEFFDTIEGLFMPGFLPVLLDVSLSSGGV